MVKNMIYTLDVRTDIYQKDYEIITEKAQNGKIDCVRMTRRSVFLVMKNMDIYREKEINKGYYIQTMG